MKKKKWLIRALLILLLLIVAGVGLGGNYLVDYAIVRKAETNDVAPASVVSEEDRAVIAANQEAIEAQKEAWLASAVREDAQIESEDGLLLRGDVFWTDPASHRWVIAVHGYGGERSGMYNIASFYSQEGYNILTPDMRGPRRERRDLYRDGLAGPEGYAPLDRLCAGA